MKLLVITFIAVHLVIANTKVLRDVSLPCHKSDPAVESCFLEALAKLIPYLSTGIPEYKIFSVDPLNLPLLVFNRTLNEMTSIGATLTNSKIAGFSLVTIDDLKIDLENFAVELGVRHPWFSLGTEFKVAGKIVNIPIETEGYFTGNFTDVRNIFKVSLKPIQKSGVKYFAVKEFKLKGKIAHARLELTSKKPQEQPLLNVLLNIFNQNERELLDVFAPLYGESMGGVLRSVLERVLDKVPAERILVK